MAGLRITVLACVLASGHALGAEPPSIQLEPSQAGRWRVRYEVDTPATELYLARNPDDSRAARWRPVDPGLELVHVDGEDRVRRRDGEPFAKADFDVTVTYIPLPKDYAPFAPFGDGGMLIHSGRFHACTGPCPEDIAEVAFEITVVVSEGTRIVAAGDVNEGTASWRDVGDGTKIYVGNNPARATRRFVAIVDEAFPAGVRATLFELFPAMMESYSSRLGALEQRPMLFASYDVNFPDGHGAQGGTLPGQVFMHLYGPGWGDDQRDEERDDWIPWFFAHEAAHLYQGRVATAEGESQAWIHEGGAEAFAALVLRESGAVADGYVDGRIRDAERDCEAALAARPLNDAAAAGAFRDYYACGLLIHLAIDAAARRVSDDERDLFDVWRVFRERVAQGAAWDQATFLNTVAHECGSRTSAAIRAIANDRTAEPGAALRRLGYDARR